MNHCEVIIFSSSTGESVLFIYSLKCFYIFSTLAEVFLFTETALVTTFIIVIITIIININIYTAEENVFLTRSANKLKA